MISIPMEPSIPPPPVPHTRRTLDTNNVHHAQILVVKYVTVKDEIANVRPPKVNTECDAGVRAFFIPGRHLDHIQVLADDFAGACGYPLSSKLFWDSTRK
jgi:hypothetical protein